MRVSSARDLEVGGDLAAAAEQAEVALGHVAEQRQRRLRVVERAAPCGERVLRLAPRADRVAAHGLQRAA